jgi:hypothetical protein
MIFFKVIAHLESPSLRKKHWDKFDRMGKMVHDVMVDNNYYLRLFENHDFTRNNHKIVENTTLWGIDGQDQPRLRFLDVSRSTLETFRDFRPFQRFQTIKLRKYPFNLQAIFFCFPYLNCIVHVIAVNI